MEKEAESSVRLEKREEATPIHQSDPGGGYTMFFLQRANWHQGSVVFVFQECSGSSWRKPGQARPDRENPRVFPLTAEGRASAGRAALVQL